MEVEVDGLNLGAAGLDLGQVEHVIDHCQQVLAALVDGFHSVPLFADHFGASQQYLRIAKDGI
ncbi:MAG: hypothetical protein L6Q70_16485, partial [Thauera sp.]|nr:hypothetical protein [Thauera sp.]